MIFSHRTHHARRAASFAALTLTAALLASPRSVRAQHDGHGGGGGHHMADSAAAMEDGAGMTERAMEDAMKAGPHMRMTALRPASAADSRRAADVVATLRRSIAKYQDVKLAEADGYRMFAPRVRRQRIYHFTNRARARDATLRFDPAVPTSLLYRKNDRGEFVLVGAMYTAPRDASEEELDRRVPLSVARWHEHVNVCVPKLRELDRWNEREGGRLRFGGGGAITTREACEAAGGRFREVSFNWMVHANVFAGTDDPAVIWGHGPAVTAAMQHATGGSR